MLGSPPPPVPVKLGGKGAPTRGLEGPGQFSANRAKSGGAPPAPRQGRGGLPPSSIRARSRPPDPANGGHYVPVKGRPGVFQLIHAVGPGKWRPGGPPLAGPGVPVNSPILNPNQPLSGRALYQAAKALAGSADQETISELQQQIKQQTNQTQGAMQQANQYFTGLQGDVNNSFNQSQQIAAQTNQQLAGLTAQSGQQLAGITNQANQNLSQYTPGGQNVGAGALATEMAKQQALGAQNAGAAQALGIQQGGNFQQLANSNRGTYALAGQQALKNIGQAGQVKLAPLNQKLAATQGKLGTDIQSALSTLRQQQVTNNITQQGLGIKQQQANTETMNAITNQGRLKVAVSSANTARAYDEARIKIALKQLQQKGAQQAYDQWLAGQKLNQGQQRLAQQWQIAQMDNQTRIWLQTHKPQTGRGGALTQSENNKMLTDLGEAVSTYGAQRQKGHTPTNIINALQSAGINPVIAQAASELWTYHYINGPTAKALHQIGVRGGTYNGKPIQVGNKPLAGALQSLQSPLRVG